MAFAFRILIISSLLLIGACAAPKKLPPAPGPQDASAPSVSDPDLTPKVLFPSIAIEGPEEAFTLAAEAFRAGEFDKSHYIASQVMEQYPNTTWSKRSLFLSGRALLSLNRAAAAEVALVRVVAEYPAVADYALFLLAEHYSAGLRHDDAAKFYGQLAENHKDSLLITRARVRLAQSLLDAGRHLEAAEAFERFMALHPRADSCSDAGLGLGRALTLAEKLDRAARAYTDLYIKYPGSPTDEEVEKALAELKKRGAAVPELTPDELYERAKNLLKAKQHEKALAAFSLVLERDPEHPRRTDVMLRSGIALFHLGRRVDAAAVLEGMANGGPEIRPGPETFKWLARTYSRLGRRDEAVESYLRLIATYPDSDFADEALYLVGNIYRDAKETKKALKFYDKLVADFPRSKFADSAIWWKAWTYYSTGDFLRTEQTLQRLVTRYPRSFLVHQARYWQGRSAEKAGKQNKAAGYYRMVIDRAPYSYYGYRAAERLGEAEKSRLPVRAASLTEEVRPPQDDQTTAEELDDLLGFDGPPVWTEDALRALSSQPSFRKSLELMYLDLRAEAAAELWSLKDRVPRRQGMLMGLSKTFFELGDYHRSLLLVLRNYNGYLDGSGRKVPDDFWYLAYPLGYWESIMTYARKYGQDPHFVAAIIRQESHFHADALSPAGARGVMQVMPSTGEWAAKMIRMKDFSVRKLYDHDTSINIGTWYIGYLMKRFKNDPLLAAAAYNAGPNAVTSWIEKNGRALERDEFVESIPFTETRWYVKKVLQNYREYKRIYGTGGFAPGQWPSRPGNGNGEIPEDESLPHP